MGVVEPCVGADCVPEAQVVAVYSVGSFAGFSSVLTSCGLLYIESTHSGHFVL